jgi:hypothetical protein
MKKNIFYVSFLKKIITKDFTNINTSLYNVTIENL